MLSLNRMIIQEWQLFRMSLSVPEPGLTNQIEVEGNIFETLRKFDDGRPDTKYLGVYLLCGHSKWGIEFEPNITRKRLRAVFARGLKEFREALAPVAVH